MNSHEKDIMNLQNSLKKTLSLHIKNDTKRNEFLKGSTSGYFTIENLNLAEIIGYSFDDGNSYLFKNCILENIKINFVNDLIYFDDCAFAGEVLIHNQGVGLNDVVCIMNIIRNNELLNITVKSSEVDLEDCALNSENDISITAVTCQINGCTLDTGNCVDVYYLNDCVIRDSNISGFTPRTSPVIKLEEDKPFLVIENSIINGQTIRSFDSDVNSIDNIPTKKR